MIFSSVIQVFFIVDSFVGMVSNSSWGKFSASGQYFNKRIVQSGPFFRRTLFIKIYWFPGDTELSV